MAITLIQEKHDYTFGSGKILVYDSNITAGNLLVAYIDSGTAGTGVAATASDSRGNVWTRITAFGGGYGGATSCAFFYAVAGSTGPNTVTFVTGGTTLISQIVEFSGTVISGVIDGVGVTNTGNSNSPNVNITTNNINELIIAAPDPAAGSTNGPGAGWTQAGPAGGYGMIYAVKVAAGVYTPTFTATVSGPWGIVAAAFNPLVVATPTFSPTAGSYSSVQSITVSDTDSGLAGFAMYYTTDGSTPTTGSTLYVGPITVSSSLTLKVLATATGRANSVIGSAAYTITIPVSGAYSVPDCRVSPFGPNASRTVQGTKIYDVQTSSNSVIPPTDSRIAPNIPVDSRVTPNIPQNSRTNPPFTGGNNS